MALLRITQERSKIRCIEKHKRTLAALGLRRINHSVIQEDNPQIRGMVDLVRYLVRVEPAEGGAGEAAPAITRAKTAKKKSRTSAGAKRKAGITRGVPKTARAATRARKKRAPRS
jgi:large subunit ribosomal protein L30